MQDLERVLQGVDREMKRKKGKLTKRFIVAEGIYENDGMMLDLPKVVSRFLPFPLFSFLPFFRSLLLLACFRQHDFHRQLCKRI
jgi:hypothetical protein